MVRCKPRRFILLATLIFSVVFVMKTLLLIQEFHSDRLESSPSKEKFGRLFVDHDQEGGQPLGGRREKMINNAFNEGLVKRFSETGAIYKSRGAILKNTLGNYEWAGVERGRIGPGEYAVPVETAAGQKWAVDQSIGEYGFNQYASDLISVHRAIKDLRDPQCRYWHYPVDLPRTSVIIVFHNEGWSTLMRTVHSIINRTPPHLLQEIVLVDDLSNKAHLKGPLDEYLAQPEFGGKIKLVRNQRRQGLIRTRTIGAENAVGQVLLWLDAHCEVGYNWLPPLLAPIAANRTQVTVPLVDVVDNMDYGVRPQGTGDLQRGGFDWSLFWKHLPLDQAHQQRHHSMPYRSPAMAGGLFAMDRKFFFELGAYDPGLEVWGGENFELSFKIWQCGGQLLWVPCSRVGHLYRIQGRVPYRAPNGTSMAALALMNYRRVAEVWMDDYKEFFYRSKPEAAMMPYGDISKQLALRTALQCRPFSWFMESVAPDLLVKFPPPAANKFWGEVRWHGSNYCLDTLGQREGGQLGLSWCHGQGGNQVFRLTRDLQFRVHEMCLYAPQPSLLLQFGNRRAHIRQTRCQADSQYHWDYHQPVHTMPRR